MIIGWIVAIGCVIGIAFSMLVARGMYKSDHPDSPSSLGAAPVVSEGSLSGGSTPAEGEGGAHPASAGLGVTPCAAVPPQGVSRPNRSYRPDPDDSTYRAMRADQLRFMAEQVEATTYDDEVQP